MSESSAEASTTEVQTIPEELPPLPLMHALVRLSDRLALAYGYLPDPTTDPTQTIVSLFDPVEVAKLQEWGNKYVDEAGHVTVVAPGQNAKLAEQQRQRLAAEATHQAELLALENTDYLTILKASGGLP